MTNFNQHFARLPNHSTTVLRTKNQYCHYYNRAVDYNKQVIEITMQLNPSKL